MRDKCDPASEAWEDADLWCTNWRAAHPDEEREDLDIYLSADYGVDSPYWPLRDVNGTLIDWCADGYGEGDPPTEEKHVSLDRQRL